MKGYLLLATTLAAGILLDAVLLSGTWEAEIYSVDVERFVATGPRDRVVRVQGKLVSGTLCRVDSECSYRFSMVGTYLPIGSTNPPRPHEMLDVRLDRCIVPFTFSDDPGSDVLLTVEGQRCQNCHELEASRVIARCPGKYQVPQDPPYHPSRASEVPRCQNRM